MTISVQERIINLLATLYNGAESCIWANSKNPDLFPLISEVRQGCAPALNLFNCTINYLMSQIRQRIHGVQLGNYQLFDLEYADDTMLFCEMITNLESALNIYHEEAAKLSLRVNWSKNQVDACQEQPLSLYMFIMCQ